MLTSRNARLALAVAFIAAAVFLHLPAPALLVFRLVTACLSVALSWPWRRCGQCSALVTRRYRIEWDDGTCERLCLDCGVQYAELAESA